MRAPGLRGRIAIGLVVTVAVACAGLSWGTLAGAEARHLQVLDDQMMFGVSADMAHLVEVIATNPTAILPEEISPTADTPLSVETALVMLEDRDSEVLPELVKQFGFVNTSVPMNERIPECLIPQAEFLGERNVTELEMSPGSSMMWTQLCGGYLLGFGYTEVPGKDGPFAWLLIHGFLLERAESPVPALGTTLLLVSIGVVILAALLARAVAATVVRPVTRAGAMAHAVAGGDLSVRIPVTGEDDLAAMSRAVNAMADRLTAQIAELEQANESQRQFVSDVAHELRTPTTALLASAAALDDPESRDQAAALVAPQLRRLAGLTEDLLEISRMDAGRAELVTSRIDLADLIAEVIVDSGAADRISYTGPSELLLTTDPARLRGVLRNLVANALQHGEPPVIITVAADGRQLVVGVHDRGAGVPAGLRSRVFDRFVRGDESRHGSSSGLGLAIAAENARLLGGDLTLEPDGSTFVLRWKLPTLDRRLW
jgi:signal transduction histidine kinase